METVYDETLPVLERIQFPMVWERLVCDVRVEDLQPARYDDALEITEVPQPTTTLVTIIINVTTVCSRTNRTTNKNMPHIIIVLNININE